ncbi:alpha/beta fold hydrolase [Sphingomonas glacialis]|uniref:Alpha/beta fold hydrolase n=1 Tax=Sphingomonas glacialis TaxID=658225 RepID=A0A502FJJ8_9SPHN|nr:alpha/beta fold hydrolase [Sphingomonas glacialis]TPG49412.1 alpha/beta fold hydrolase [Sphingomonas glacialis]
MTEPGAAVAGKFGAHVTRAYAPSRIGQLHYRIAAPAKDASAPPLLCLHQTPSNSVDWEPLLPLLGADRVVVAVDTPGYGMSDAPPAPLTIEMLAAVMAEVMAHLTEHGIVPPGPFDLLGQHTGSVIATELARAFPARIRRLVLFGLAAFPPEIRAAHLAMLRAAFPAPDATLAHVEKLWAAIGALSDPRLGAEARHRHMAECLRGGSRIAWGYESVFAYDFLGAIPQVTQPVLVMNPEDDLWDVTLTTAGLFPNGERFDMPGVGHGVLSLERDRVAARIEAFLG